MKIREMTKDDFDDCAELIFIEFNKQDEGFTKKTALGRVTDTFTPGLALCAEENNQIIGLIVVSKFKYAKGDYFWIDELVVKEEFHGKGIGKHLMQEIESIAKKKNINALGLNTKKFNLKFYEKLGFEKTDYVYVEKDLEN